MSEKEKNLNVEPKLEQVNEDELDSVVGGKGFTVAKETVIGGNNKIKTNSSSFLWLQITEWFNGKIL